MPRGQRSSRLPARRLNSHQDSREETPVATAVRSSRGKHDTHNSSATDKPHTKKGRFQFCKKKAGEKENMDPAIDNEVEKKAGSLPTMLFPKPDHSEEAAVMGDVSTGVGEGELKKDRPDVKISPDKLAAIHEAACCRLSRHDLAAQLDQLTPSQAAVFRQIEDHYNHGGSRVLRLYISGSGGTGKSYLSNLIIAYLQHSHYTTHCRSPVIIAAPTGTAARNVRGRTLHSLLQLPFNVCGQYKPLDQQQVSMLQPDFVGVHTLMIDEISMVSSAMLSFISHRLQDISGSNQPFGGFNIIVIGDLYQLRPVKGAPIFEHRTLWRLFSFKHLSENVRQSSDREYGRLLHRARLGLLIPDDIGALKTRLFDPNVADPQDTLHVFPRRKDVDAYNASRQRLCPHKVYTADTVAVTDDRVTGELVCSLSISVGTRVMLLRNLCSDLGLVNGAIGTVTSLQIRYGSEVMSVSVLFDDPSIGYAGFGTPGPHVPIDINKVGHTFKHNSKSITRKAFPLMAAWACTIHKVQGMTFDTICVDIGSDIFEPGMSYVALSRVRTLNGLYIVNLSAGSITSRRDVLEEYDRLRVSNPA